MSPHATIDKLDELQATRMFIAFQVEHGPEGTREEFEQKLAAIDSEINKLLLQ